MTGGAHLGWTVAIGMIAALGGACEANAQAVGGGVDLRGQVLDSAGLTPMRGVSVTIDGTQLRQTTDNAGQFTFPALLPGRYVLRARHVGYRETTLAASIVAGDTGRVSLSLAAVVTRLEAVQIADSGVRRPSRFDEPYKRAAAGRGYFFTRKDLDEINAHDYQTLLDRIPTVSATDRGITFQRCRDAGTLRPDSPNKVQIWVDGRRITGQDPNQNLMDVLRSIPPHTIEIMEVYASQSVIPAAYMGDACAVIALWTKSH